MDIWNNIVATIGTAITILLTILIIMQTSRLAKKQQEFDLQINAVQKKSDDLQIKLAQRDDKTKAFKTLYNIFDFSVKVNHVLKSLDLKSYENYNEIFDALSFYNGAGEDIEFDLKLAEFVVSNHIKGTVVELKEMYRILMEELLFFKINNVLPLPDKEKDENVVAEKIKYIIKLTNDIDKKQLYIGSIFEHEIGVN